MQIYIEDLGKHVGETVMIRGWLYNLTKKGRLCFLLVRDGSGLAQSVVFKKNVTEETFRLPIP